MSKIIGLDGKKIKTSVVRDANVVICQSRDGEEWEAVHPDSIPEWLKNKEVMGDLVGGYIVQQEDYDPYYRAQVLH